MYKMYNVSNAIKSTELIYCGSIIGNVCLVGALHSIEQHCTENEYGNEENEGKWFN